MCLLFSSQKTPFHTNKMQIIFYETNMETPFEMFVCFLRSEVECDPLQRIWWERRYLIIDIDEHWQSWVVPQAKAALQLVAVFPRLMN